MDRLKIARELNKIAKELIAGEVANQQGRYRNFTGTIDWPRAGIKGQVKNATFWLDSGIHGMVWYDGTWQNGIWGNGTWWYGTWKKGTWKYGWDKYGKSHKSGDSPDKWEK